MEENISVTLTLWQWAAVACALQDFIPNVKEYDRTQKDAVHALKEIDRVARGAETYAPLDDLL